MRKKWKGEMKVGSGDQVERKVKELQVRSDGKMGCEYGNGTGGEVKISEQKG